MGISLAEGAGNNPGSTSAGAGIGRRLGWREAAEQTVVAMGYEPVDIERSAKGLLRVFIDRIPGRAYPGDSTSSDFITVDDCEQVTRQLQFALEVDAVAYERLEVSSPGLDRPLKRAADFERFAGHDVSVTLKLPFQGRKVWKGQLQPGEAGAWTLVLPLAAAAAPKAPKKQKPALKSSQHADAQARDESATGRMLTFTLDEVREARLVPVVDFKGRRGQKAGAESAAETVTGVDGGQER